MIILLGYIGAVMVGWSIAKYLHLRIIEEVKKEIGEDEQKRLLMGS
jgi:hypothetical protein